MVGLGHLEGNDWTGSAYGISADGSVVVGQCGSTAQTEAFRWTEEDGMVGLGHLEGQDSYNTSAKSVSADGLIIVGSSNSPLESETFRWTEEGGMVGLGDLAGGGFWSIPRDVSADGSVIVGSSLTTFFVPPDSDNPIGYYQECNRAYIWDEINGMRNLSDELTNKFGLDLTEWALYEATGISDDGLTIVGFGENPDGYAEGWIATIPEPATLLLVGLGCLMVRKKTN